jgi:hypothetical protein
VLITVQKVTHSSIQQDIKIEQNISKDGAVFINKMRMNLCLMSEAPGHELSNVYLPGLEILLNFAQILFLRLNQN